MLPYYFRWTRSPNFPLGLCCYLRGRETSLLLGKGRSHNSPLEFYYATHSAFAGIGVGGAINFFPMVFGWSGVPVV